LGCGASGIVVVVWGVALGDGCCCVSEASGYVVTGCSGACDGFTVVPWFVVPWLPGCGWLCPADGCCVAGCVCAGCVFVGCVLMGCCGCWEEVSGGCCAVDGLLCCAINCGAEHTAATSNVLRMLMIRCCTVIKNPRGTFCFCDLCFCDLYLVFTYLVLTGPALPA
jgi:hypothetical protein